MGFTTPSNQAGTTQPHNIEAEQQILGALLLDNSTYNRISDVLKEEHFFDPVHARVYDACARRIRGSHMVDPIILKGEFADATPNQLFPSRSSWLCCKKA